MASGEMTRREFLAASARTGAGLAAAASLGSLAKTGGAAPGVGQITQVVDSAATGGFAIIDPSVVQIMMDAGIKAFTGEATVGAAWRSLFPGITAASVIGIKVNLIYPEGLPSHPEVADAIAAGLTQMDFSGAPFPENNIIIWDRYGSSNFTTAGYTYNTSSAGVRCYGTPAVGYDTTTYNVNGVSTQLSRILIDQCNYIINLPVIKNHSMSGMTGALKNSYGINSNPGSMHGSSCNPYIADLYNLDPIRGKVSVVICDGLYGLYSGGPTGGWTAQAFIHNSLYISTDPVAVDRVLLELINQERTARGYSAITTAYHIQTAANRGLGTDDPAQITISTITNPSSTGVDHWEAY